MTTGTRAEHVRLVECEVVAGRGRATRYWLVQIDPDPVRAVDWPGAVATDFAAGPGTVWQRRLDLDLPRGTVLIRVQSRPAKVARRDALAHFMEASTGNARTVTRVAFRVAPGGRLDRLPRLPEPDAPPPRRLAPK